MFWMGKLLDAGLELVSQKPELLGAAPRKTFGMSPSRAPWDAVDVKGLKGTLQCAVVGMLRKSRCCAGRR